MKDSLRAILSGVVDYAGLFPPAELPLDQSIRNYARYCTDPDRWMLGRFICPASRLAELLPYVAELFGDGPPLTVAALGRSGKTAEQFVAGFGQDVQAVADFQREARRRANVDVLETRVPQDVTSPPDLDPHGLTLFFESTPGVDWRDSLGSAIDVARRTAHGAGFKLRTGGVEASAFPLSERVAFTLVTCRDKKVPLKFTAGLHHPIRHFNVSMNARMHGFINVLVAGVLAHAHDLSEDTLVTILDDEEARNFVFEDGALCWNDLRATTEQITRVRHNQVISFGSCSFDEPRDDLRAMGLL